MADFEVSKEKRNDNNWSFEVNIFHEGKIRTHNVTLSFSDYDYWSHGRVAPAKVVHAAFEFLLEREPPKSIMSKFDCSIIRRYFSEVDKTLPTMF